MIRLLRKAFGRYWKVELAFCLAFTVAGFTVEPGGPTGSMFDVVIVATFLLISIIVETCGWRADNKADEQARRR